MDKEDIKFEIDTSKKEDTDIFPPHFLAILIGWPGSGIIDMSHLIGKTSLMKFMLKHPRILFKKFDEVLVMSRNYNFYFSKASAREFGDLFLPSQNYSSELDWTFIQKKIDDTNKIDKYTNMLIIIDDFITELNKEKTSMELRKLVFNRRHQLTNGMISIIITTQKYTLVPTSIRSNLTILFTFQLNNMDIGMFLIKEDQIKKELIRCDTDKFQEIVKYIFEVNIFLKISVWGYSEWTD